MIVSREPDDFKPLQLCALNWTGVRTIVADALAERKRAKESQQPVRH